jgi:hypothetical protein
MLAIAAETVIDALQGMRQADWQRTKNSTILLIAFRSVETYTD